MQFDVLELVGMAAGLIAAALFIGHVQGPLALDMFALVLAVGPFVARAVRRARRGSRS